MAATDKFMKRQAENAKADALVCLTCKKAECNGSAQCFREMKSYTKKKRGEPMKKALDARMKAIEQKAEMLSKFAPIHVAIRRSFFYDELPEDSWRDLYCEYVGIDRAVLEQIMQMALGDLHFIMRDIEKPTTDELKEIIAEVEQMVTNSEELET